jgi:hypothetical protein
MGTQWHQLRAPTTAESLRQLASASFRSGGGPPGRRDRPEMHLGEHDRDRTRVSMANAVEPGRTARCTLSRYAQALTNTSPASRTGDDTQ